MMVDHRIPQRNLLKLVRCSLLRVLLIVPVFAGPSGDQENAKPRIIGGSPATPGDYPYLVDLDDVEGGHWCMGELVAPDLVLTAAHCQGPIVHARVGRHDKSNPLDGFDDLVVVEEMIHPKYIEGTFEFDIMLLRLNSLSDNLLLRMNDDPLLPSDGEELHVAGFGNVAWEGREPHYPDVLHDVTVNSLSNQVCAKSKTKEFSYKGLISGDMLCARDNGQDSCQGDSGGPLILKGDSPKADLLVGVVSWGLDCADPNFPGVYARISSAYVWIRTVVCQESVAPPLYLECNQDAARPQPFLPVFENPIEFVYEFTTDAYPNENEILLHKVNGLQLEEIRHVLAQELPLKGTFKEALKLEEGGLYSMTLTDGSGDGLEGNSAGVKLFLRDDEGFLNQIRQVSKDFVDYFVILFYATLEGTDQRFDNDPSFVDDSPLTLEIDFGDFPAELGLEIRYENGTLLFYRPPGFYFSLSNSKWTEEISFPMDPHNYTLTVSDAYGDGLGYGEDTGYRLGNDSFLLVSSSFESGQIEVTPFTWPFSSLPSAVPSDAPSATPVEYPSENPSAAPVEYPSETPSAAPIEQPSVSLSPSVGVSSGTPSVILNVIEEGQVHATKAIQSPQSDRGGLHRRRGRKLKGV